MAIRYEPTQPGNPNELTHRQHVFPKRSIERFYQDGRVDFVDLSRGKRRQARADEKMFCGERAWSHGAEHGFMKDIEDAFQALAEAIIVDPDVALDHEQTETLIRFYGLWAHRARNRRLPFQTIRPKSRNLLGVRIECTEDKLELLEKNNIIGTRPNGCRFALMICPLLSGPISILELVTKEEWNGEEAQAGRDHRQAA